MKINPIFQVKLLFVFVLFFNSATFGQIPLLNKSNSKETIDEPVLNDPWGRNTPRGSVRGFIESIAAKNYQKASHYLHYPSDIDEAEERENIVLVLKHLFDKKGTIFPYSSISNQPEGKLDDNLAQNFEKVGMINTDEKAIDVLLNREKTENEELIWLFSEATLDAIQEVSLEYDAWIDYIIPPKLNHYLWAGVPAAQWIIAVLIFALSFVITHIIIFLLVQLLRLFWKKSRQEPISGIIDALRLPAKLYFSVFLFIEFSQRAGLSIILRQYFSTITLIIGITAILILLWRLIDYIGDFSKKQMELRSNPSGLSVILFLERAAKIALVIFGIIAILSTFGIDITTGLAALGIGGIALALGAQKTVENFVGSVTLIADRPIRVGDFCRVGQITGTIEKIGIRSTNIRTLDRTLVTIPNGLFSSETIENFAFRDKFRMISTLNFRYESSPDQIRYLLAEFRKILYSHPKVYEEPSRVRFVNFGAHSLDIEIFAYIVADNNNEFLEIREDIMLRIMEVVKQSGTGFAFPSQTLYFAKDDGLDKENSKSTDETVEQWRVKKEMPLPRFTEEQIDNLKNKIDYPPEGSSSKL
ncbi:MULTISPECIES: mechanosensitive ion channel family protein [Mesonia]|uniref:mechanosensitive ion channel family protein n=1 Tax=Mesonia TaxID=232115 RepID=UPI00188A71F8|nr:MULTISPECIES: mechanosensitive ion channel family protein [Mesonia]